MSSTGWIGVDLDGTLAKYDGWKGHTYIGDIVPEMRERVIKWLALGTEVRIFTARVSGDRQEAHEVVEAIHRWLDSHGLPRLKVTCVKDYAMLELYDDRAVQVEMNTGRLVGHSTRGH